MQRILLILLLLGTLVGIGIHHKETTESLELSEFIENLDHQLMSLTPDVLVSYEKEVIERLDDIKNRNELKKAYSYLAYVNFYQGEYEESNNYFVKELSIGKNQPEEVEAIVLMGISKNYLYLENNPKSDEYFEYAKSLAIESENDQLLSLIYQMRAKDYINLLVNTDQAVQLLQESIELSSDVYQNIMSCLILKNLYLGTLQIDLSNQYALKAITLAQTYGYEDLLSCGISSLVINEYLNESYTNVILIYEDLIVARQEEFPFYMFGPYIYSIANEYGIEKALELVEDERVNSVLEESEYENNYKSIIRAKLYIEDGQKEKALEQLLAAEFEAEGNYEIQSLNVFKNKLYGDIKFEGQELLDFYVDFYEEVMKGDIDSVLRILLLKDIIQKNLELENYEQAFYFASQIPTPLKSESSIQINLIEENLKNTMSDKVDDKNPSLIIGRWILVGGLLATILFVCYNKKRKSLRSKKQDLPDKEMEALTLQQLYDQCSEKYSNGSVFVVDLDNFKKFNETYGYIAGDQVIEQVFELIKSEFKEGLLTRHNGQQFIIVTQDDKMRAAQRAQQLIDKTYALNIEHVTNLRDLRMTLSVGIVCGNLDSSINLDKYLKKAQDLVLISKEKGKNRLTI